MKDTFSCLLALPGGDNHAGIWNSNTDAGYQLGESVVVDSVFKRGGIDIIRVSKTGDTDGMWTDSERSFQMFCVHQESGKLIAVLIQSE